MLKVIKRHGSKWNIWFFQLSSQWRLKSHSCVLKLCTCSMYYNHNTLNFWFFGHHIDQIVSKLLVIYFYYTTLFQFLYSIYFKLNEGPNDLIFLFTKEFKFIFLYLYVKHYKLNFWQFIFLFTLPCSCPTKIEFLYFPKFKTNTCIQCLCQAWLLISFGGIRILFIKYCVPFAFLRIGLWWFRICVPGFVFLIDSFWSSMFLKLRGAHTSFIHAFVQLEITFSRS